MIHLKRFLIGFAFILVAFAALVVMASLPDVTFVIPLTGAIIIGVVCYIFGYGLHR